MILPAGKLPLPKPLTPMLLASGSEHEGRTSVLLPTIVKEVFIPNSGIPGYNQHSLDNQLLPGALAANPLSVGCVVPTLVLLKILKGSIFF